MLESLHCLRLDNQGNTHAKRSIQVDEPAEGADSFRVGSPPVSPGSPLTYSPQVPMEPIAHARSRHDHDSSAQRLGTEFVGAAGWPAQPKLVPVEITCEYSTVGSAAPLSEGCGSGGCVPQVVGQRQMWVPSSSKLQRCVQPV